MQHLQDNRIGKREAVTIALQRASFLFERGRHQLSLAAANEALAIVNSLYNNNDIDIKNHNFHQHDSDGCDDMCDQKSLRLLKATCLTRIGAVYTATKRHEEALSALREAVRLCPNFVEALRGLAYILSISDAINFPEAVSLLRRAHELERENAAIISALATLLTDIGVRLKHAGLPAEAIKHYSEAVVVQPEYSQAYYNLGVAYADSGLPEKAVESYKKCIDTHPGHVEAWCNLGVIHKNSGRLIQAMECYNKALQSNPNFELAKRNLSVALCEHGTAYKEAGDRKSAKMCYKRAIALCPNHADAHYNLGVLYVEEGKLERALASYSLAIHFNENLTEAHNNLGVVHKDLGNLEKAMECYKNALKIDSSHHQTHNNIAVGYTLMGNTELATDHLKKAIALCPTYAEAHNNYGVLLRDEGDIDGAIAAYEKCIKLDPRADMAAQNRLHALNYSDFWTKEQVYHEHRNWGEQFQARIDAEVAECAVKDPNNELAARVHSYAKEEQRPKPSPTVARGPGTGRPLRVAYISPDLFTHSVSYFAEVLLKHHDSDAVAVYVYANVAQPDAKTERLKAYPAVRGRWRNIYGVSSVQVAALILADEIDILVELAGHTANNRLDVMALRLAPVQLTWIGYPNTTGLSCIHYRVVDGTVDPVGTTQKFTEKLWRLPQTFLCYTPAQDAPKATAASTPCGRSGGIVTFGSFNVLAKCQGRTLRLWATILKRVPNSRLLIKAKPLGSQKERERLEAVFAKLGVASERLDLVPLIPATASHLEAYANMDIALDPFPYAGTTTTCEALYMGVPVITMGVKADINGDHAHNVGASLLTTIGHPELVAYSEQEYADKAVLLAGDTERLQKLRKTLRSHMMDSALGEGEKYTRNVEHMFCNMWSDRGGKIYNNNNINILTSPTTTTLEDKTISRTTNNNNQLAIEVPDTNVLTNNNIDDDAPVDHHMQATTSNTQPEKKNNNNENNNSEEDKSKAENDDEDGAPFIILQRNRTVAA